MKFVQFEPFFSVVIPTYNRAELVKEAIESVLGQSFENFEILLVDDHSNDDTKEIVKRFKDPRVIYLQNERKKGAPGARNTGIYKSKGEWIAFLDSDDIWLPDKLNKQFELINKLNDEYGLIYTGIARYDFKNNIIVKNSEFKPKIRGSIIESAYYKNPVKGMFSTSVIRKDLIIKAGAMDEDMPARQDPEFCIRISKITKIDYVSDLLVYLRLSLKQNDRISQNKKNKIKGYVLQLEKHYEEFKKRPKAFYRMHTRIVSFAIPAGEWKYLIKYLPNAVLSLFYSPAAFFEMIRFLYNKTWFNRALMFIKRRI